MFKHIPCLSIRIVVGEDNELGISMHAAKPVCLPTLYIQQYMCTVVYVQLIARMLEVAFLWVPLSESQLCDCMIISQARLKLRPLMGGPLL